MSLAGSSLGCDFPGRHLGHAPMQTAFAKDEEKELLEGANPVAESIGAFGTILLSQQSDTKKLGSRRDREHGVVWYPHSPFDKELQPRMQIQ